MHHITLANRIDELERLHAFLVALATAGELPESEVDPLNLVLEELVTNVIRHAHDDDAEHEIRISIETSRDGVEVEVEDDGRPFDPADAPRPDLDASLEERPIGGLGVHLVREMTDELRYERVGGSNIVRLKRART